MDKKRLSIVDDLRGISILVMILIHTNAYFLKNKIAYMSVELSQFAVVAFVFCSAYLLYLKLPLQSFSQFISYLKKRVIRLVLPYYCFLALYLVFLIPKEQHKLTFSYLFHNLFFTGGLDFNWLVLLFLELTVLMPLFKLWKEKRGIILIGFTFLSFVSTLIFLAFTPLPFYRWIMWLPWSLVVIYTLFFPRIYENKKTFWLITIILFLIFILSQQYVLVPLHHSLRMYDNKYPPNIYHLSYGIMGINLLYFFSEKGLFSFSPVRQFVHFFSLHSYSIFFVHILVIYALTMFFRFHFNWITFFLSVLVITFLVQLLLNKGGSVLQKKK